MSRSGPAQSLNLPFFCFLPTFQNFSLYPALVPTLEKTSVSFLGFQDGSPLNLRCRIKTEDKALEFKNELEKASRDS